MTGPTGTDLTREDPAVLREDYRQMTLIRAFELRAAKMYTRTKIGGYCRLNPGEEATVIGLIGRAGGMSRGRGRPMHLFDRQIRLMGGYGIAGGQIPLTTAGIFS